MINAFSILAEATSLPEPRAVESTIVPVNNIWTHMETIRTPEALMFISFGLICMFYGWRIFKALTIMSFALIGLYIGSLLNQKMSWDNPIAPIVGALALGIASIPLMKWAVGILGALAGAVLTSCLWFAMKLPDDFLWAGALIGLVAGGMSSFIIFKLAIILFTSIGGTAMFVSGVLALLCKYPQTIEKTRELFLGPRWFAPVILIVPVLFSVFWQNRFAKKSPEWTL